MVIIHDCVYHVTNVYWLNIYSNEYLVGGFSPSEKYEFVSWDHSSQLNGKS